ncbi:glycosyltransferase [Nocardioides aurantiacus]|uniref:Glycosyltransferase involved in cell wall biosynthesis n=1 Tax=Nocardioides aurantiacus TaxID=86796 RepID=A0A3N2CSI9_9ACTN|nr:glycosyltransferase [Nocardioides aurantiacus]ROR90511.1 glycosyltransferase involved in cell wall biosynthesis [Nocardioides aurantiacus]
MAEGASRILFVGINYAPEPTGIAPYTAGMASGLARRGHDVRVVTGYPHYPWWEVPEGYAGRRMREQVDGVPVERRRHHLPGDHGTLRRAAMEVDFGVRSTFTRWGRPDVVVAVSPAMIAARMTVARARAARIPVVTWVQDIYTLGLVETGGSARQQGVVRAVERGLLQASTRAVVIHDRFRSRLVQDLAVTTPIDVVRNWSHVEGADDPDRRATRASLGWADDDVVVLHAGNMGAKQGLENVVDASRLASDRRSRVRFVLLGGGNQAESLRRRDPNDRLQIVDPLPDGEFERALGAADVLLVNELPGLTEMSVPSKLTTYYATGLPVLAAVGPASTTALEVGLSGGGVVVPAGDPAALLGAAESLGSDPGRAAALGAAGGEFRRRHLTEAAALDAFEQTLSRAVGA